MKALTICQPYAHMILLGEKRVENRTWPTNHRGLFYIHAGKSRAWWDEDIDSKRYQNAVFGAVVAIATLLDCLKVADVTAKYPDLIGHCHVNGPWCWILRNVTPIGPWSWRGAQGLFEIDVEELGRVANRELGIPQGAHSKRPK